VGPLIVMATSAAAGIAFSQLSLFFVFVPLWTRTLTASSTPRRKEAHQNALTSLAGQTYHPHDGWRCRGW
jgi:hypothetical protein